MTTRYEVEAAVQGWCNSFRLAQVVPPMVLADLVDTVWALLEQVVADAGREHAAWDQMSSDLLLEQKRFADAVEEINRLRSRVEANVS